MRATLPSNEKARLSALHGYRAESQVGQPGFDKLTRKAAELLSAPIALISLVDAERQFFLSHLGVSIVETSRDESFCAYAIHSPEVMVVCDAASDPRFFDNPLVLSDPKIRFYVGAPLETADGLRIGTLCVIDTIARPVPSECLLHALKLLAQEAMQLLERHRASLSAPKLPLNRDEKQRGRALLVEDIQVNQMIALAALRRLGWEADTAVNGLAAVDLVRKNKYSIIFMDCHMPVMDGYSATTEIRRWESSENRAHVPIVALTANSMAGNREQCIAAGMDDFMTKPLRLAEFSAMLELRATHSQDEENFGSYSTPLADTQPCAKIIN